MPTNSAHQSGENRPPAYSRQKEKGRADRAYVWLNGKKEKLAKGKKNKKAAEQRLLELRF